MRRQFFFFFFLVEIVEKCLIFALEEIDKIVAICSTGSEWDYVILSTVCSLPQSELEIKPTQSWITRNLGFITDTHQINVALTRAKLGLIIIGKLVIIIKSTWL